MRACPTIAVLTTPVAKEVGSSECLLPAAALSQVQETVRYNLADQYV